MASIKLGEAAYNRGNSALPETELVNLFVEKDDSGTATSAAPATSLLADTSAKLLLQRPGLLHYADVAGTVRGMYQSDGVQNSLTYVAAGGELQSITLSGVTSIAAIANDGKPASFAAAFDKLAVASGGLLYFLNNGVLTNIPIPDADTTPAIRFAIDITDIANYIIVANPDGRWFYVNPGEADLTSGTHALQFFTAESKADGLVACRTLGDELYLFGTASVEVWQATGSGDAPFQRAAGRNFAKGCMNAQSVKIVDNSLFWVGDNSVVYRASAVPSRISTFSIEEHIARRTGDVSAMVYTHDAHEFYALKIPGRGTFAYDAATKSWSRLKSNGSVEFTPAFSVHTSDGWLLGDTASGTVLRLDRDTATDNGQPIERVVTGVVALPNRKITRNDSVSVTVGSSIACNYRLRWRDGQNAYPASYRTLPARAGADNLTTYRLGAGTESFRVWEISIVDPAIVRISGMTANESFD